MMLPLPARCRNPELRGNVKSVPRQKVSQNTEDLKDVINYLDVMRMYRTLAQTIRPTSSSETLTFLLLFHG